MLPFRFSSVITAKISVIQQKNVRLKLSVLSVEKATHTKDARTEKNSNPNVLIVKDHMLQTIKVSSLQKAGVPSTCGGQPKKLCLHFETKYGSDSTIPG